MFNSEKGWYYSWNLEDNYNVCQSNLVRNEHFSVTRELTLTSSSRLPVVGLLVLGGPPPFRSVPFVSGLGTVGTESYDACRKLTTK